jgi:hypothetical protein
MALKMTLSKAMIEAVMDEWERANPGKDAIRDMSPTEMGDRMMEKIKASAEIIPELPPHPRRQ